MILKKVKDWEKKERVIPGSYKRNLDTGQWQQWEMESSLIVCFGVLYFCYWIKFYGPCSGPSSIASTRRFSFCVQVGECWREAAPSSILALGRIPRTEAWCAIVQNGHSRSQTDRVTNSTHMQIKSHAEINTAQGLFGGKEWRSEEKVYS